MPCDSRTRASGIVTPTDPPVRAFYLANVGGGGPVNLVLLGGTTRNALTDAATSLIVDALSRAAIPDPVVYLLEAGSPRKVPPEAAKAFLRGERDDVIRELMSESIPQILKEPMRLIAAIHPRGRFPRIFLTKAAGYLFVCPLHMRLIMRTATLDVEDGQLVLRNKQGHTILPRSRVERHRAP
jgi:hypothetical protein